MRRDGGKMSSEKKHRQHHVPQRYLKEWCRDGTLWCRRRGSTFPASPANIAHERDFYRVYPFSLEERAIVRGLLDQMEPQRRELANSLLGVLSALDLQHRAAVETLEAGHPELRRFETARNNLVEDWHAQIEDVLYAVLDRVRAGEIEVLAQQSERDSLFFGVSMAYSRTDVRRQLRRVEYAKIFAELPIDVSAINVDALDVPLSLLFAVGATVGLASSSTVRIEVLCSEETAFITSGQPVVNLYPHDEPTGAEKLFYPLSPTRALMIMDDPLVQTGVYRTSLTSAEVYHFNREMMIRSPDLLFARDRSDLDAGGP